MDNDDLRRGNPTCHIAFHEATAILAGDALQPLAYETITNDPNLSPNQKIAIIQVLTHMSGAQGLALGQQLDIEQFVESTNKLEELYHLKTGIFFEACIRIALIISKNTDTKLANDLISYTRHLGLAFQIQDDILDIEIPSVDLGKPQGSDQKLNKVTYPNLTSLTEAKHKVNALTALSIENAGDITSLIEFANYLLTRRN